ncbi:hypothetical protein HP467_01135 [Curtobacterium albidum]|uniref:Uncharacterized protein n=1 Tax=Curtobacterium citreum TaxID=2036 RepID=A0A850DT95_9MICO|nr:hypothetical protein [Curtobacterium albidum]NUU26723.1 hypothetical protein [Curtobacterium albidum]
MREGLDNERRYGVAGVPAACPRGWDALLDRLDRALLNLEPAYEATRITSKFGGLRFRVALDTFGDRRNEARDLIFAAEEESLRTCEICGQPGNLHVDIHLWRATLCETHADERGFLRRTPR